MGVERGESRGVMKVVGELEELGKRVVVVEEEEEMMGGGDYMMEMGGKGGGVGGEVVYEGEMKELDKGRERYRVK